MNNRKNPGLERQKTLDRMRKKRLINKGGQKICLILLIRNQANTINELLDSLKPVIDSISIIDTKLPDDPTNDLIGSILNWCKINNLPNKIVDDRFKNFSYNRTNSIKIAKNAFPDSDYFLLSELDFIWNVKDFDKISLSADKYDVIQNTDYYRSTRLLSAKINWVCHLETYEYWTDINNKNNDKGDLLSSLSINDNDNNIEKYNTKISLLLEDLSKQNLPKYDKSRIKFYLGYLCKEVDMFEDSIKYSMERLEEGGCKEEIYYSLYNIGISYEKWSWKIKQCSEYVNQKIKTNEMIEYIEKWNPKGLATRTYRINGSTDFSELLDHDFKELLKESAILLNKSLDYYKKAYEYRPTRSESLYSAAKLYRTLGITEMYKLAYQTIMIGNKIKLPSDYLFVNKACYDYLFDFELLMIARMVNDQKLELYFDTKEAFERLSNRNDLPDEIRIIR